MEGFLPFVVAWVALATIPALVAPSRGRSSAEWFGAGLVLSPLIALIILIVLPNRRDPEPLTREDAPEPPFQPERGPCPRCGESIPLVATMCHFCNLNLVEFDRDVLQKDLGDQ